MGRSRRKTHAIHSSNIAGIQTSVPDGYKRNEDGSCSKIETKPPKHHRKHCKGDHGGTGDGGGDNGGGDPPPTVVLPTPPQVNAEDFCVQTFQRGETYVQATPGAFDADGDWFNAWATNATVVLDGHSVQLLYEGGKGVILAAHVPYQPGNADAGYFATCGQPYVSTDGVYANPLYGLRGEAWEQAVWAAK